MNEQYLCDSKECRDQHINCEKERRKAVGKLEKGDAKLYGERVATLRELARLTQEELSQKISEDRKNLLLEMSKLTPSEIAQKKKDGDFEDESSYPEVSPELIRKIESKRGSSIKVYRAIARSLGCSPDYLTGQINCALAERIKQLDSEGAVTYDEHDNPVETYMISPITFYNSKNTICQAACIESFLNENGQYKDIFDKLCQAEPKKRKTFIENWEKYLQIQPQVLLRKCKLEETTEFNPAQFVDLYEQSCYSSRKVFEVLLQVAKDDVVGSRKISAREIFHEVMMNCYGRDWSEFIDQETLE